MLSSKKITVDSKSAGTRPALTAPKLSLAVKQGRRGRLDVFLASALKITRSQTQKMIRQKLVLINKHLPKKTGEILKENDVIKINEKQEAKITKTKKASDTKNEKIADKIRIVAKTPDYIIVDKPAGILTHPTQAKEKNTLSGWLVKKYPEIKKVSDDPARPGIVHRLDKEASGLLVIGRTQKMFEHLKAQFKNRTIEKEYIVLAHGKVAKDWAEINFPIGRSETAGKMAAMPMTIKGLPSEVGKEAATEFFVEQRFVNFTLLKVIIHTGRMHQIRAHLFAYNHPVVGDPLYFQKKQKRTWDEKCGRLFLHCAKLGFTELGGKHVEFEAPIPSQLKKFLTLIK